ncbi:MAG: rod shape-determining protein MreD [Saccharofermentanales bacterium]
MERSARIRQLAVYAIALLGSAILQIFWPGAWMLWGARPDFTLVLSVLSGFLFGIGDGIAIGLAAGYLRDSLAGRSLGMGMLLLMYAGICGALLFRQRFRRQQFFALILVALVTVFYTIFIFGLNRFFPMVQDAVPEWQILWQQMSRTGAGSLLLNLAAAVPMFQLLLHAGPYRKGHLHNVNSEVLTGDHVW